MNLFFIQMLPILFTNVSSMTWTTSTESIAVLQTFSRAFIAYHNQTVLIFGGWGTENNLITFSFDKHAQFSKLVHNISSQTTTNTFGYQRCQSSIQIGAQLWMLPYHQSNLNVFDLNLHNMKTISFSGSATCCRCVTNYNEFILVIGGWDGSSYVNEFMVYDTRSYYWFYGNSLTNGRGYHSCNIVKDTAYIIGGYMGRNYLSTVEYLTYNHDMWPPWSTWSNGSWQQMSDTLSHAKWGHKSIVFQDEIYVIGGLYGTSNFVDQVDIIRTISKTISVPADNKLVNARADMSLILLENVIYAFGGLPANIPTSTYYQYAITPTISPTNAPTIPPTNAPTITPTNTPTNSPTRYPTGTNQYNQEISIIYEIKNLYSHNTNTLTGILDITENIVPLIE
eukprot:285817_1